MCIFTNERVPECTAIHALTVTYTQTCSTDLVKSSTTITEQRIKFSEFLETQFTIFFVRIWHACSRSPRHELLITLKNYSLRVPCTYL